MANMKADKRTMMRLRTLQNINDVKTMTRMRMVSAVVGDDDDDAGDAAAVDVTATATGMLKAGSQDNLR